MGRGLSDVDVNPDNYNSLQLSSKLCKYFQNKGLMGPAGLEENRLSDESKRVYENSIDEGWPESGTDCEKMAKSDPNLQKVIDQWPILSEKVKEAMLALIAPHTEK